MKKLFGGSVGWKDDLDQAADVAMFMMLMDDLDEEDDDEDEDDDDDLYGFLDEDDDDSYSKTINYPVCDTAG